MYCCGGAPRDWLWCLQGTQGATMRIQLQIFSEVIDGLEPIERQGYDTFTIPSGGMKVNYNLQFGQMCVDPVYDCAVETVNATFAITWQMPSSPIQLWNMDVNNLPPGPVYKYTNSTTAALRIGNLPVSPDNIRPYSFEADTLIRTYLNFPNAIDVCDRPTCNNPLVTFNKDFAANVTSWVSDFVDVGVSLGSLGMLVSVPTTMRVSYTWVGIYASMTIDPVVYVDGVGKFLLGDLNIKVMCGACCPAESSLHR
jgi:hypothetical protein